jgi:plastocyanin
MKKYTKNDEVGRSLLVITLIAVGISGTGILLSLPTSTILGNTLRVVSNAYGASDSVFGDTQSSTNTDNNNDNPKDDGDNQGKDQNKEKEQSGDETSTTSSSNIAPQTSSSGDNSQATSSEDSTASTSGSQNASIVGIKSDKSFDPNPINMKAGDSVTWTNNDNDIHTVTSGSDEGPSIGQEFDSGTLGEGQSFTHKFENPGTYEYFCSIHPSMVGKVIVK